MQLTGDRLDRDVHDTGVEHRQQGPGQQRVLHQGSQPGRRGPGAVGRGPARRGRRRRVTGRLSVAGGERRPGSASQASSRSCLRISSLVTSAPHCSPWPAARSAMVREVRQLLAHGTSARRASTTARSAGERSENWPSAGQELRLVSGLLRRKVGEHVVQQLVAHRGERVHQPGRAAVVLLSGLGDRAGLLEPPQGRVQRVVVQHDTGGLLDPLAQLIPVGRAAPEPPQDQDLDVRHIVQYDLCTTGR